MRNLISLKFLISYHSFWSKYLHGQVDNPIYYSARDNRQLAEKYNQLYFTGEDDKNEDNNGICIDRTSSNLTCAHKI